MVNNKRVSSFVPRQTVQFQSVPQATKNGKREGNETNVGKYDAQELKGKYRV